MKMNVPHCRQAISVRLTSQNVELSKKIRSFPRAGQQLLSAEEPGLGYKTQTRAAIYPRLEVQKMRVKWKKDERRGKKNQN